MRRQRNMAPKQDKTSEKELNKMEKRYILDKKL